MILSILSIIFTSCKASIDKAPTDMETSVIEIDNIDEETDDNKVTAEYKYLEDTMRYATYSAINDGRATLYKVRGAKYTVCVNAGHGTKNPNKLKVYCHPDFSEKVAGGTTGKGEVMASAISDGTVLDNGMAEKDVNLLVACRLKDKLIDNGYSVLMIREDNDCNLDNIARTLIANKYADIHIAIHFDSTENDKGAFYITPFNDEKFLSMEPLKSHGYKIYELGKKLIEGLRESGVKIWKTKGELQGDLTQMSYSTIANVDIELGDKATEINEYAVEKYADGLLLGINKYFGVDNVDEEETENE